MYCESQITHIYPGDVEHIEPKIHFEQRRLDYDNLGISCWSCNHEKLDEFSATTPLIDPYNDDPAGHFIFIGQFIRQRPGSARGRYTIELLKLNDRGLPERRLRVIDGIAYALERYESAINPVLKRAFEHEIEIFIGRCAEYSAFARAYARACGYNP